MRQPAHPQPDEQRRNQRVLLAVAGSLILAMGLFAQEGWPLVVFGLILLALSVGRR